MSSETENTGTTVGDEVVDVVVGNLKTGQDQIPRHVNLTVPKSETLSVQEVPEANSPIVPQRKKSRKHQAPEPPTFQKSEQEVMDDSDPPVFQELKQKALEDYSEPPKYEPRYEKVQVPKFPETCQVSEPSATPVIQSPQLPIQPSYQSQTTRKYYPMEVYATVVASFSFLCIGLQRAYTSPAIASMKDDHTFFNADNPMSKTVISWVAASPPLASFFGTIISGLALQYCGRQKTLVLLTLPFIVGWLLIGLAKNTLMIMTGRALTGLAAGFATATCSVYVSECVRAKVRGFLGVLPAMMLSLGILLGFALSTTYLDWQKFALLMACFPILLLLFAIPLPESPSFLIMKGKESQAIKSLQKLRGVDDQIDIKSDTSNVTNITTSKDNKVNMINLEIQQELEEMKRVIKKHHKSTIEDGNGDQEPQDFVEFVFKDLLGKREIWFPAFVSLSLMVFQQFTGANAVIFYLSLILTEAAPADGKISNSSFLTPGASDGFGGYNKPYNYHDNEHGGLDHTVSSVVVGLVQFFAFFLSLPLIDRVGRRVLLIVSAIFMIFPHLVLGLYFYVKMHPTSYIHVYKYESIIKYTANWLPLTCLCVFIASYSIGFGPVPFILMAEIFPIHLRSYMCALTSLVNHLTIFLIVRIFPVLLDWIGPHIIFWLFALFCLLAAIHVSIVVPETKGKTLAEIELEFMHKDRRDSNLSSDINRDQNGPNHNKNKDSQDKSKSENDSKETKCNCKHETKKSKK